jgi:hypothetical protein
VKYDWNNLTEEQKQLAAEREMELVTHNGTTKDDFINIMHFLQGTIETQQQEIEQLRAKILIDVVNSDFVKIYDGSALERADEYIGKLEQEIEKLKKAADEWKYEAECHMDEVISSKKENEKLRSQMVQAARGSAGIVDLADENTRLQVQTAAMREVLEHIRDYWNRSNNEKAMEDACWEAINTADNILSADAGKDYHNPTDAEALKKLTDDFAALNSLYDAENETFTEIVQKEKELLKEIDKKDTALERAVRGVKSIVEQYTTDFTEEELSSDVICPREKVVLEYAKETLEVIEEAIGGEEDGI